MTMNGYTLRIAIRDDLVQLYKLAMTAKQNRIAAMELTVDQLRDITEVPAQFIDNIQAAALNTEKVAFANIGQFFFDRLEELEAELDHVIDNSETGPDEVTEESHCYSCGQYLSECVCDD